MNKDSLIDALGQVDDDLYQAADALRQGTVLCPDSEMTTNQRQQPLKKKNNRTWVRWTAMAACLCVVGAGALLFMNRGGRSASTMTMAASSMESAAAVEGRSVTEEAAEEFAETTEDTAAAEAAIAPQADEAPAEAAADSVESFAVQSSGTAAASAANGAAEITVEIITADLDEVLMFTDTAQAEAILTWLSESGALTADEFAAQYGSLTDHAKWPAAVTVITIPSADGSAEPEIWYVPAALPETLR